ncbi:MAG: cobalamin B12-binding domain-containing protein [Deltaproteobacteria bacterium]|nr:cobalamin B12-binding domain-containing protein [Deltaproteobacteria bacterium]
MSKKKLKVLVSKVGLDGHDRGVKVVTQMLRNAGMEVVYLGIHQTCEAIVEAAIQEDVDVVGLSSLGGGHLVYSQKILDLLTQRGAGSVPVVLGGTLPFEDIPVLEQMGIRAVFPAGTLGPEIIAAIERVAAARGESPHPGRSQN